MWDDRLILERFRRILKAGSYAGPVAVAEIEAAEQALGVRFPPSYRLFLREFGAAWLSPPYEAAGLGRARHTGPEPPLWPHVVDVTATVRRASRGYLPECYVPVSGDGGDCTLYLDTGRADQRGECPVVAVGPGLEGAVVAPSFLEFAERVAAGDPLAGLAERGAAADPGHGPRSL
jgi:antitoxin YobK